MNEIRLGCTIAVNAFLFLGAWRFVRRWVEDLLDAAADAVLVWYLVQYCIVTVLGVAGVLSGGGILACGCAVGALMWWWGRGENGRGENQGRGLVGGRGGHARRLNGEGCVSPYFVAGMLFGVIGYLAAIIWVSRYAPAAANDALAYHLPAAVQWLQTGKFGLFHTWFYNPANTYSPLAGSVFIAWLMGPMGNDSLARFVEAPAILLLFFGVIQLARLLGATICTATVLGFAVAAARPFISQTVLAKDDVVLAGFLVCAMGALSRERLLDALGVWRVGAAVGLLFATKYTAIFNLPLLLLAIDAPWRAGWRWGKYSSAIGVACLLAGPWFIRNWVLTGNPIYPTGVTLFGQPIFRGGLQMLHSDRLTSVQRVWETLVKSYYSPPAILVIVVAAGWLAAMLVSLRFPWRRIVAKPLVRAALLGPPLAIAIFIFRSPYGEVRLIGPSFALLFCTVALIPGKAVASVIAMIVAIVSFCTGFESARMTGLLPVIAVGFIATYLTWIAWIWLNRQGRAIAFSIGGGALAMWTMLVWPTYLRQCDSLALLYWQQPLLYGNYADAWVLIRTQTPSKCTIAYDNFFMVYPLFGPDLSRRVVCIPAVRGVHELTDLPFMGPTTGEEIPGEAVRAMNDHADRLTWVINLLLSGADYVLVGKRDLSQPTRRVHPATLDYMESLPTHFRQLLSNDSVEVYQVVQ